MRRKLVGFCLVTLLATAARAEIQTGVEIPFTAAEDHAVSTVTGSGTLDATVRTVIADTSGGAVSRILPACTTATNGRDYIASKVGTATDANTLTIAPSGTDKIAAANASVSTSVAGAGWWLQCNGATATWAARYFANSTRAPTATGLTAAGTTLATALALTADVNEVTTAASGSGVSLAPYNATLGGVQRQEVISAGANALAVYPPVSTAAIRNLNGSTAAGANGAAVSLAVGSHATFECVSATLCYEAP